ncbi:MAG: winged helix DNA-binding domain-containing protein [Anaerolineaceae bacterium]|nr:winged helix DNA-binding domain-containing protein [Anaerolineaceae bacterium]
MLAAQGLLNTPDRAAGKADLLGIVRQIHALQIDTLNIVARAPYHILYRRIGNYPLAWLNEAHAEGALFEYWAHAACFLPIEDYPLYRRMMLDGRRGWDNINAWGQKNPGVLDNILEYIRENGAVKSSDFKGSNSKGTWWTWKVEKVALEHLFTRGDVMIARREKFQRVYELRERVLPDWDDSQAPDYDEVLRTLVLKTVKALGVAREDWISPYFYLSKSEVSGVLPNLVDEGRLIPVSIEGMNGKQAYVHPDNAGLLEDALAGSLEPGLTTFLSPFDPLVTDRKRTKELFDFDYVIECYTPAAKRVFGYFTLPILHRGKLIGRMDAKAWRKEKYIEVISLHLEPGQVIDDGLITDLKQALEAYAAWQSLDEIVVRKTNPPELEGMLT